jgi:hypothetical protein
MDVKIHVDGCPNGLNVNIEGTTADLAMAFSKTFNALPKQTQLLTLVMIQDDCTQETTVKKDERHSVGGDVKKDASQEIAKIKEAVDAFINSLKRDANG